MIFNTGIASPTTRTFVSHSNPQRELRRNAIPALKTCQHKTLKALFVFRSSFIFYDIEDKKNLVNTFVAVDCLHKFSISNFLSVKVVLARFWESLVVILNDMIDGVQKVDHEEYNTHQSCDHNCKEGSSLALSEAGCYLSSWFDFIF